MIANPFTDEVLARRLFAWAAAFVFILSGLHGFETGSVVGSLGYILIGVYCIPSVRATLGMTNANRHVALTVVLSFVAFSIIGHYEAVL